MVYCAAAYRSDGFYFIFHFDCRRIYTYRESKYRRYALMLFFSFFVVQVCFRFVFSFSWVFQYNINYSINTNKNWRVDNQSLQIPLYFNFMWSGLQFLLTFLAFKIFISNIASLVKVLFLYQFCFQRVVYTSCTCKIERMITAMEACFREYLQKVLNSFRFLLFRFQTSQEPILWSPNHEPWF